MHINIHLYLIIKIRLVLVYTIILQKLLYSDFFNFRITVSKCFQKKLDFYKNLPYNKIMEEIYTTETYTRSEEIPVNFKLTEGKDTDVHKHHSIEIIYIINGTTPHKLDDEPVKNLQPGDTVIVMPSHKHEFLKHTPPCTYRTIIIKSSLFKEACNFIDPFLYDKFARGALPYEVKLPLYQINIFEQKINVINQMQPERIDKKTAITRAFAVAIIETIVFNDDAVSTKNIPAWFKQLLSNFNTFALLKEGLSKITEDIPYDKKYLCRVFKKYMGITMTEHLNKTRLDYALAMIQGSNLNILDISQSLGFSSISYFNTTFKKRYGLTPLEARKKQ